MPNNEMSAEQRADKFFDPFSQQHYYTMLCTSFHEAIDTASAQGKREGLEEAAKVAETTVYNERPGSKAIAAAIRSRLTTEST